jgi:hypothetical protein
VSNIRKLVPADPYFNNTNACFAEAFFLKATGSVSIDTAASSEDITYAKAVAEQLIWTMTVTPPVMVALRALFTNETIQSNLVVLDHFLTALIPQLEVILPHARIVTLPQTDDLSEIADCMARASLFITAHISTSVYGIFLSPGAAVIEVQPKGFECTAFGQPWTRYSGARYIPFRIGLCAKCNHTDLACYLRDGVDYDKIASTDLQTILSQLSLV